MNLVDIVKDLFQNNKEFIESDDKVKLETLKTVDPRISELPIEGQTQVLEGLASKYAPKAGIIPAFNRIADTLKQINPIEVGQQFFNQIGQAAQQEFKPGYNPLDIPTVINTSLKTGIGQLAEGVYNLPGDLTNLYYGYEKVQPTYPITQGIPNALSMLPGIGKQFKRNFQDYDRISKQYPITSMLSQEIGEEIPAALLGLSIAQAGKFAKVKKLAKINKLPEPKKVDLTYKDVILPSVGSGIAEGFLVDPGQGNQKQRLQGRLINAASGAVTAPSINIAGKATGDISKGLNLLNDNKSGFDGLKQLNTKPTKTRYTSNFGKKLTVLDQQKATQKEEEKGFENIDTSKIKSGRVSKFYEEEKAGKNKSSNLPVRTIDSKIVINTTARVSQQKMAENAAIKQGLNPRKIEYDTKNDEWVYNPDKVVEQAPPVRKTAKVKKITKEKPLQSVEEPVVTENATSAKNAQVENPETTEEGGLTYKEREAKAKKEASNYRGKVVSVDGKNGKIVGNSYQGRVKVEFEDGTTKTVPGDNIKSPVEKSEVEVNNEKAQTPQKTESKTENETQEEKLLKVLTEPINLGATGRGHVFDVKDIPGAKIDEVKSVYDILKRAIQQNKEIAWKGKPKTSTGKETLKDKSGARLFDPLGFSINKDGDIRVFGNVKLADGTFEQRSYRLDTIDEIKINSNKQISTKEIVSKLGKKGYTNAYRGDRIIGLSQKLSEKTKIPYEKIREYKVSRAEQKKLADALRKNSDLWKELSEILGCYE